MVIRTKAGESPFERRKKLPAYDPRLDGNVFDWIFETTANIRKNRELARRVDDQPPRLRKI
jgi:hypothetical protein